MSPSAPDKDPTGRAHTVRLLGVVMCVVAVVGIGVSLNSAKPAMGLVLGISVFLSGTQVFRRSAEERTRRLAPMGVIATALYVILLLWN